MSVTFTFIRHAESIDNLRQVWAGWKNSTLSNHANTLAKSLASTSFTAILTSDLERTRLTAEQIQASQPHFPPLTTSKLLREQNFGQGEGKPFVKKSSLAYDPAAKFHGRNESHPKGESLVDVEKRATQAWQQLLAPYIENARKDEKKDVHIAVVSHGIFISELIAVIVNSGQGKKRNPSEFRGMKNTAWTRIMVQSMDSDQFTVKVTSVNSHRHLDKLIRQKGIGSVAYDPKQGDIRSFFGTGDGGKVKK
ncbi:histidine phosphatase superfamily [Cyathus striatus]|nr:histidine phosphatase superfamily [Cyathus striatus]